MVQPTPEQTKQTNWKYYHEGNGKAIHSKYYAEQGEAIRARQKARTCVPWHCDLCNKDVRLSNKTNHLRTAGHRSKETQ